ncbi:MAG: RluA family pseudouridine synthase, partial [Synechococcales cyanobacterium CRU_2_2]|nr:RluA family pseudouridine synthase [Synechococcales cyanobacterium CRU_2_2]
MPRKIDFIVETATVERLDRWLVDQLEDFSRSRIQTLLQDGYIRINGAVCTNRTSKLKLGDQVRVTFPKTEPLNLEPEDIPLDVLFEDDHLIIINKPVGMVIHPSPGHRSGTLVHALLFHCKHLAGIGGIERPGIVHRLDKDTTGALVVAKTDVALQHLQTQLREKTARREYLGVVFGSSQEVSGTINAPIGRHPSDRKKQAIISEDQGGRAAVTHWRLQERLGNYSLMHFQLETGRTHQIRVHCQFMGNSIVGDPVYGSGRSIGVNLPGQALHAWRLSLVHPIGGEPVVAIAPPAVSFT